MFTSTPGRRRSSPDLIGQELQRDGYVREAATLGEPHDVLHARQVHDGDHGFGVVAGGRPQARPAYGYGDGLFRMASGRRNVGAGLKPPSWRTWEVGNTLRLGPDLARGSVLTRSVSSALVWI